MKESVPLDFGFTCPHSGRFYWRGTKKLSVPWDQRAEYLDNLQFDEAPLLEKFEESGSPLLEGEVTYEVKLEGFDDRVTVVAEGTAEVPMQDVEKEYRAIILFFRLMFALGFIVLLIRGVQEIYEKVPHSESSEVVVL